MGKIRKLTEKEYEKYSSLWDGEIRPELIEKWKEELLAGRRIIFLYEENEEILGEAALVLEPPVSEEKNGTSGIRCPNDGPGRVPQPRHWRRTGGSSAPGSGENGLHPAHRQNPRQ